MAGELPETPSRPDPRVDSKPKLSGRLLDAAALAADAMALILFTIWYNVSLLKEDKYFLVLLYGFATIALLGLGTVFARWSLFAGRFGLAAAAQLDDRYFCLFISALLALGSLIALISSQDILHAVCISALWLSFLYLATKQAQIDGYDAKLVYFIMKQFKQVLAVAFVALTAGLCFNLVIHRAAVDSITLHELKSLYRLCGSTQEVLEKRLNVGTLQNVGIICSLLTLKYWLQQHNWPDVAWKSVKSAQHCLSVLKTALIVLLAFPILGMVSDGPLATLELITARETQELTELRRDVKHAIQATVLMDIYNQAWDSAPARITAPLKRSEDIGSRRARLEQSNLHALHKYGKLFESPLSADVLPPLANAAPDDIDDLPTQLLAASEKVVTLRRLQDARGNITATLKEISADAPPKWLTGLKEDLVKQVLNRGFDILSHQDLLKQISLVHPLAGLFLDALKDAGVDSVLEAIRPIVNRLVEQSLLEPKILLPNSIVTTAQALAKNVAVSEVLFGAGEADPTRALTLSESELEALESKLERATDKADRDYRVDYSIRVHEITEMRSDFIALRRKFGDAGLFPKLDRILERDYQKVSQKESSDESVNSVRFMEKHWPDEVAVILSQHPSAKRDLGSSEWARREYNVRIEAARIRHLTEVGREFRGEREGKIGGHGK
jgi:hypothetical protein